MADFAILAMTAGRFRATVCEMKSGAVPLASIDQLTAALEVLDRHIDVRTEVDELRPTLVTGKLEARLKALLRARKAKCSFRGRTFDVLVLKCGDRARI